MWESFTQGYQIWRFSMLYTILGQNYYELRLMAEELAEQLQNNQAPILSTAFDVLKNNIETIL